MLKACRRLLDPEETWFKLIQYRKCRISGGSVVYQWRFSSISVEGQ